MSTNKKFWDKFYSSQDNYRLDSPSMFAQCIYRKYIHSFNSKGIYLKICDLGCGNCRDSKFLAKKGNQVIAIDKSGVLNEEISNCELILDDAEEIMATNRFENQVDIIYMRWFFTCNALRKWKKKYLILQ